MSLRRSIALALVAMLWASSVRAEPSIEIRARSHLELHPSRRDGGTVRVRVVLTDDVGAPLAGAIVSLEPRAGRTHCGTIVRCTTDREGSCVARLDDCPADTVFARFEGDSLTDGSEVESPVIDHGAEPRVRVSVDGGSVVDLESRIVHVDVSIDGIASMPARITLADELGHVILHRAIEAASHVRVDVAPNELGPPGLGAIVATIRFDDGSEATGRTMVARRTRTRLRLAHDHDTLVATLEDGRGPVVAAIVGFSANGRPLGDARTDARGTARIPLDPAEDDREVRATFHSNDASRSDVVSRPLRIPGRRASHFAIPLALASLGVFALVALRRARREETLGVDPGPSEARAPVSLAAAGAMLPTRFDVGLRILARDDDAPLVVATASVDGVPSVRFVRDADRLLAESLPMGSHTVTVEAEGHAPERVRVRVPHRGEWSNAIVRLESARTFARRAIPIVARAAARDDDEIETMTYREADSRLAASHDPALRADLESAVYGAAEPTLEAARNVLSRTEARANAPSADNRGRVAVDDGRKDRRRTTS